MEQITMRQFELNCNHYLQNAHKVGGYIIESGEGDMVLIPASTYNAMVETLQLGKELLLLQQDLRALQNSMMTYQQSTGENSK